MISRGELNGVSIGYRVSDWESSDTEGNIIDPNVDHLRWSDDDLVFAASRWELLEISLCCVPSDDAAGIRAKGDRAFPFNQVIADIRTRMQI
jgi:phage head maturation protease